MSSLFASWLLVLLCTGQLGLTRSKVEAGEEGREMVDDLEKGIEGI